MPKQYDRPFAQTVDASKTYTAEIATTAGGGYAVFGKVVEGMDVVDKIRMLPVGNKGPYQNVPVTPVTIKQATLQEK